MSWMPRGVRRAFRLDRWTGAQVDRELDEEFRFHLEMRETELREAGWSPESARHEALRRFGDLVDARRYCRRLDSERARTGRWRDQAQGWAQDVRFAVRQLRRAPTLALVAVLTLSLAIGATTAIFSVVHRLMLAPLPYPEADRIVSVMLAGVRNPIMVQPTMDVVEAWRTVPGTFERIATFRDHPVERTADSELEILRGGRLSAEVPAVLGVRPRLGRFFAAAETRPGGDAVAMLGHGYWQRAFGGRPDVVGRQVTIDGRPRTVIGVLPRDFVLPSFTPVRDLQVVLPLVADSTLVGASVVGRLQAGVTPSAASARLAAVMSGIAEGRPHYRDLTAQVRRQEDFVGERKRDMLLVLLGAVAVVLLIACANVAGLLMGRAAARQRELAVRSALGAGRGRLVRQLLTESAMIGLLGGAGGILVAWGGLHAIIAMRPGSLDELAGVRLDPLVLAGTLALALVTSLLFGLAPAVLAAADGLRASLVGNSRSATGHRGARRLRATLVGGEVALSVVLLVCAGLLVRSVLALHAVDVGFEPRNLAGVVVQLPTEHHPAAEHRPAVYHALVARVRAMPGVQGATLAMGLPPESGVTFGQLEVDGPIAATGELPSLLGYDEASPDYFTLIGTRLLYGHVPADTVGDPVVINASLARRLWPAGDAVGGRIRMSPESPWMTVAGVVADVRRPGSTSAVDELRLYRPHTRTEATTTLLVRTSGDAPSLLTDLRRVAAAVDPTIKLVELRMATGEIGKHIAGPRFSMTLLAVFAGIALVLATVGLYGVVSLAVTQRTREIGVRMALGASPRGVTGMVVRQAMVLAGAGVVAGLVASVGAVRLVRGMLYGVEPLDAPAFAAAALALGVVAFAAALVPARRAARVDAMEALRAE